MGIFSIFRKVFKGEGDIPKEYWDNLLEQFILADMDFETSNAMVKRVKKRAEQSNATKQEDMLQVFADEIESIFSKLPVLKVDAKPEIVVMIGVNGVGKTTTIAKLALMAVKSNKKVLLAAGDTFRAAAVEQLKLWADRIGAGFYGKGQNADPAAVAWGACDLALKDNFDIVFVDTAGRLHTQSNLMDELRKIKSVIAKKIPGAPHRMVLIIDANTGQNALAQVKQFKDAVGINELILTKMDGTSKGGALIAIVNKYQLPISYVGMGEGANDLIPFNGSDFAKKILEDSVGESIAVSNKIKSAEHLKKSQSSSDLASDLASTDKKQVVNLDEGTDKEQKLENQDAISSQVEKANDVIEETQSQNSQSQEIDQETDMDYFKLLFGGGND